jgi:hypothetical protein
MKVDVYERLPHLNAGFDEVITALAALRKHSAFPGSEVDRLAALVKETRAASNSFLTSAIEAVETADAGRRYHQRLLREREEEGS